MRTSHRDHPWLPDALGLAWVVVASVAVLVPALLHGASLGPYDGLARYGLTTDLSVHPYNLQRGDLVTEMIPWATQTWQQVHHGFLPLWSPLNGLGQPLAFNWQSAVASLPSLVGYLAPVRLVFTTQVLVTVLIAGTGAYVAGRVLRLGVVAAAMTGTTFVLSGAFFVLVGWPAAGAAAWSGWLIALATLILRGQHLIRWTLVLSVAWAFCLLAGQPDTVVASSVSAGAGLCIVLGLRLRRSGSGTIPLKGLLGLAAAGLAGLGLAAPVVLPGLQLAQLAIRSTTTPDRALSPHLLVNLLIVGYDGLPFNGSPFWGTMFIGSAMWVGPIVVVLALVALVRRRHQAVVLALAAVMAVDLAVVFVPLVISGLTALPAVGSVMWRWSLMPMMLALALLAGHGIDELVRAHRQRAVLVTAWIAWGAVGATLGVVWLLGGSDLNSVDSAARTASFVWPVVGLMALAMALVGLDVGTRISKPRVRHGSIVGLLVAQVALLVSAGAPLWHTELTHPPHPPAVAQLRAAVGGATVGFGAKSCFIPPTLGIQEQANVLYGIHEFNAYDPMTATSLFDAWALVSGGTSPGTYVPPSQFCPAVTDARIARRFGIRFLLVAHGTPGPFGTVLVRRIANEDLYRVPGAAAATLVGRGGPARNADTVGRSVALEWTSPSTPMVAFDARRPSVLRLHLQRVPGWTATIDGRPLVLRPYSIAMLQADVPTGHHVVRLVYRPTAFVLGSAIALCTVLVMMVVSLVTWRRRPSTDGLADQA